MITLTKYNVNERCRTCLCKLIKNEDNSLVDVSGVIPFQTKFVDVKSNKELQDMLRRYVFLEKESDLLDEELYPQYICTDCLRHLQTFEAFRNKALESAKKLYEVFSEELHIHKIDLNGDGLQCKENQREDVKDDNIFNLFLKDSLMETEAIILEGPDVNNDFNNVGPDPFQSTQKQENKKKTKARRMKKNNNDSLTSNKSNIRKSKRYNKSLKDNKIHDNDVKTEEANKLNVEEEVSDWHDNTFQDHDNNSSDNEVLSNKILHSQQKVKERKSKVKKEGRCSDSEFFNHNFDESTIREESKHNATVETINNLEIDKQLTDNIKSEPDSDGLSSDSDFIFAEAETYTKAKKTEKRKRHCILNTGRKKGLANRYKCDQCQHKFGHKLTLEAHIRKVHEGQKKAFKCQMCEKAYSFIGGLSTHIRDVHERKQDTYDCTVPGCDKKYSNFMTLQRHVRFKHLNMETTNLYVCEQCGATFKQSSNLRYHMKTRHPTEEDLKRKELMPKDRLECEECKKSFHSQYTLKYHKLRVHADEKKFECKICGRRVAKQFMLDSHMLVHSDQKLACKFCGREFVRKYQVEAHIRAVHQKLKPFQCPHCSESFASRKTLRHHIYIHTGEKPYVCDICGQAYRQPTCLKNHRKIHNKLSVNDMSASMTANRNFSNNFVQNNEDAIVNSGENLV